MLSIFEKPVAWVPDTGDFSLGQLRRLIPAIAGNIQRVKQHYQENTYTVFADHMCNVLLQLTVSSLEYPSWQFLSVVTERASKMATQRGVFTTAQKGKRYKSRLYPHSECYEYWLHLDDIDYFLIPETEWDNSRTLVCLDHGFSDLTYDIPNGRTVRYSERDVIWGIDIVGMCLKYRQWALQRLKQELPHNTTQFIHSQVLPQALDSIIDISLINRYWCMTYNLPVTTASSVLPMYVIEPHRLDHYLRTLIKTNRNRPMDFRDVLKSIPVVSANSGWEALWFPDVAKLDSVMALFYYSRLHNIERLVYYSVRTNRLNKDYIAQLIRLHNRLITGSLLDRILPDVAENVRYRINKLQMDSKTLFEVES